MIITSIPRSGSTHYCNDLAVAAGKPFVDEPFSELNQSILTYKKRYHECSKILRAQNTVDDAWSNRDSYIISNHNMILPLLESTDVFLSRRDLKGAMRSLFHSLNKVFSREEALAYLKLYLSWTHMFLKYISDRNIKVIIAEDLGYIFNVYEECDQFETAYLKSKVPSVFPEF
jgi:hypothetical protein